MVPCAPMAAKRLSLKAFGAITLIAASAAWLTGGALTVTSSLPGAARIGLAPSPAWLAVWLVAACVAFLIVHEPPVRAPPAVGRRRRAVAARRRARGAVHLDRTAARLAVDGACSRACCRPGGDPPGTVLADADGARPAPRAVAGRGHRRRRVPGRRLAGLSAAPHRRRAALPRHRAEPRQGPRPANREQPPPRRLSRLLRGRPEARLPPARPERRNLLGPRAGPLRHRRPGAGAVRLPRRARVPRARQRVGDGADVDGHVARDVGRGGQLVRLGNGRAERAVLLPVVRRVPGRARRGARHGRRAGARRRPAAVDQTDRRHGRGAGAAAVAAHALRRGRGDARPDAVRAPRFHRGASRRCCRFRSSAPPAGSRSSTRSTDRPTRADRTAAARRATSRTSAAGSSACSSISSSACCPPRRCSCARWPGSSC